MNKADKYMIDLKEKLLNDEIQACYLQLGIIERKMNADYKKNKDKRLRWYKEYLIVKTRINDIKEKLYRLEQLIQKLEVTERPKMVVIKGEPEKKGLWNKFKRWWEE